MKHTLTTQIGIGIALFFLVLGALMMDAKAAEPQPSRQNIEDIADIKGNQVCINANRPAYKSVKAAVSSDQRINADDVEGYNAFLDCKGWNASETENLARDGWCPVWNEDPERITLVLCKATEPVHAATGYDLDKLAKAVAMHETKDCGVNVGSALVNNCFGIRGWDKNGKPYFKKYATKEDSYKDFKRIWSTYYGQFPNTALAKKYSGNDRPQSWLANVSHYYETL